MPLSVGTRLGPYEILSALGAGGMGEVYRARDTKLDRAVAIKILPEAFAADTERIARFQREAKTLASLNHLNIAHIHGLEESSGVRALVMELVEGEDLAERIARGAIPVAEALPIAKQMADALEAAHEQGIIHRDLKPANIKVRPDGTVKVLDFGLAKAMEPTGVASPSVSQSPTITTPAMTQAGMVLGTAAYMSPEQARGKAVDRRTDIWAFGAVLFEMLTGQRAFQGDSVADTLAAIVHGDPRLDRLPSSTPWHVRATIDRCLQKDARDRARDMADVRMALDGVFSGPVPAAATRSRVSARWLVAAALAGALLAGASVWFFKAPPPESAPTMRFRVSAPEGFRLGRFALSPDGRNIAFTATSGGGLFGLWVHSLESDQSRHLERAGQIAASVFWSPDSKFIGFVARSAIHRIAIDGTPPQLVTPVDDYSGARWAPDGTILYGRARGGLMKVPATGGAPVAVTELDAGRDETGHTAPVMLPDGHRFLYFRGSRNPERNGVFVGSLDAAPAEQSTKPVLPIRTPPLLSRSPDGAVHLLFVRDGTLMAQELDTSSMTLSGSASTIAERVALATGFPQVSVAGDTLAFREPDTPAGGVPTWFARDGRRAGPVFTTPMPPVMFPQISPDGTRLAAIVGNGLWVYPLDGRPPVRLTSGNILSPRWGPDGQSIVYERFGSVAGLHAVAADGSSSVPRAVGPPGHYHAHGFIAGGRGLLAVFQPPGSGGAWQLVHVAASGTEAPARLGDITLPDGSASAALSPDGHWLAYIANTTGSDELWVRRYPTLDGAVRVSPNGATEPVWSKDGRELFYLEGEKLMIVRVRPDTRERFAHQPPMMLFEKSFLRAGQPPSFDVAADGRLLMLERVPAGPSASIEVIVNWRDHVARRTSP